MAQAAEQQLDEDQIGKVDSHLSLVPGLDKLDKTGEKGQQERGEIDMKALTPTELRALETNQITMPKLVEQHKQAKAAAEAEIKALTRGGKHSFLELRQLQRQVEDEKSPEKLRDYLKTLQEMANEKEKDKASKEKIRKPEDKELMDLQKKFDDYCDREDVKNALEKRDNSEWKKWFADERKQTPTIAHLEEKLRLNKEDIRGDTIAKRVALYGNLKEKFKKYGLDEPIKNDYILTHGYEQREEFLKNIKKAETHFGLRKDTGFYSTEILKKMMQENLMADSNEKLAANILQAENISRKETAALNEHFKKTVEVEGFTLPAMSEASKTELLNFYKNASFKEREEVDFKSLVENEGKLAKDLKEVFTDQETKICNKEALKKALGTFSRLDFLQKQNFITEQKRVVKGEVSKEESECLEIKGKALVAINKSSVDKNISDITRQKYSELFNDPTKFKNPKTGKPGDSTAMQKAYDILTSTTPHNEKENRNLIAYKIQRDLFRTDLEKLKKLNPALTEEDVRKWEERYDKARWDEREHIHKTEIHREIDKQTVEANKRKATKARAGVKENTDDTDSKEKVVPPEFAKMRKAAYEFMLNGQGLEALKAFTKYAETDPNNPRLKGLLNTINAHLADEGFGSKAANTDEEQLEDKMEDLVEGNETIRKDMREHQIDTLNTEGAVLSMERHQRKVDTTERAKEESMDRTQSGSLEAELTADFYKQEKEQQAQKGSAEKFILGKDKTGEKTNVVKFKNNDVKMTEEAIQKQRQEIYGKQTDLDTKKGFSDVELENEQGQNLTAEAAKQALQQKQEKLAEELSKKAQEDVAKTKTDKTPGATVFSLNDKIAARRKAEDLIAKRSHEKIRNAA